MTHSLYLSTSSGSSTSMTIQVRRIKHLFPKKTMRKNVITPRSLPCAVLIGQLCPTFNGFRGLCGGAGWAMSAPLHMQLVDALPHCARRYFKPSFDPSAQNDRRAVETESDRFLSRCFIHYLNVSMVDRAEFNSQPPLFYETADGRTDHPHGYGYAATFHYLTVSRLRELINAVTMTDDFVWWSTEHAWNFMSRTDESRQFTNSIP